MSIKTWEIAGLAAAALSAGTFHPVRAQLAIDAEASTFVGSSLYLENPPAQFAILSAKGASPYVVHDGTIRDAVMVGANAGIRINDRFGVEGLFAWAPSGLRATQGLETQGGKVDTNVLLYGGTLTYHFVDSPRIRPFVGLGIGGRTVSYQWEAWRRQTDFMSDALVGAEVPLRGNLSLRVDARDCLTRFASQIPGVDNANANDLLLSAGLAFKTGLHRK